MYTMNRCLPSPASPTSAATRLLAACCCCAALLALAAPAAAQTVQPPAGTKVRNFPEAALRGTLVVTSTVESQLNGKAQRMAPGMRLFNVDNALVPLHMAIGKPLRVNYVIEASTGMLITAWILNTSEVAQKRKGEDTGFFNFSFESDTKPALR
ncbi:MAG: hypothetical protein EOO33_08710 [Comamonadaceae bacterium]|nr:MAG: hypothetical protein EOO33_08710 [Comamonadaceae bacterium]